MGYELANIILIRGEVLVLNTIVVALDGNEKSSEMINQALKTLQIGAETKIILCHVFQAKVHDGDFDIDKPHKSQDSIYSEIEKQLQYYLSELPCTVETEIVTGDPPEEIIRIAQIYQADLIVLGTRGLKGVKRVIAGSVSSQVLADAPCSVLVIKSKKLDK